VVLEIIPIKVPLFIPKLVRLLSEGDTEVENPIKLSFDIVDATWFVVGSSLFNILVFNAVKVLLPVLTAYGAG
jgi:hypothetical protein